MRARCHTVLNFVCICGANWFAPVLNSLMYIHLVCIE